MALSPMMKQYLEIKEQHKDAVLLYRLGDFYEMFFDDAIKVSRELELTLTGRDCGLDERAPMCGVPYHAAEGYIAKLLEKGYKVAICEQVSKPGEQKGIVKREIVREITPGTKIDQIMLDEKSNNYIVSVYLEGGMVGVSWADISTGELCHSQIEAQVPLNLNEILSRLNPAEIICNSEMLAESINLSLVKFGEICPFTEYVSEAFDYDSALIIIKDTLRSWDVIKNKRLCVSSAGALLHYINKTQHRSLGGIFSNSVDNDQDYVMIDNTARKTLELTSTLAEGKNKGSLLWLLDVCKSAMGSRLLKKWIERPSRKYDEISARLDSVGYLISESSLRDNLSSAMSSIFDLSRLIGRVSYGNASPRDLRAVGESLKVLARIKELLLNVKDPLLLDINKNIDSFDDLCKLVLSAIKENPALVLREGGIIEDGFDAELDEYRSLMNNAKDILKNIEAEERRVTGIKNLKISYNRVFGYYIEVSKSQVELVPYRYIRRQTLAGGERYITEELKEIESKILNAEDLSKNREFLIFEELLKKINEFAAKIIDSADAVSYLDCIVAFSEVSESARYTRPLIGNDIKHIKILEGRHPVVEKLLKGEQFVPNDTFLDSSENRMMLITGPNMAGKSIYMRQVAIITILAHIGCYVPAKSAEIAPVDKIFTRVGASDDLLTGRSTFMVEMSEVAYILENATDDSLILLDEIGRGTATFDGLSIAWAIVQYLTERFKCKTLFSTHYHELTELEGVYQGLKNYKMSVREVGNTILFMRKLLRGSANRSFGIEVAGIAGVPSDVLLKAKEIYKKLEAADITRGEKEDLNYQMSIFNNSDNKFSNEIIAIIKDLNVDELSPKAALDILFDLKEKCSDE